MIELKRDIAVRKRFDQPQVAAEYVKRKNQQNNSKNRREMQCIEAALNGLSENSLVLDLPTGTGRLLPMLLKRGFRVIAADYSEHMLKQAKKYYTSGEYSLSACELNRVEFIQMDIMETKMPDLHFDACICNRLFHHYPTSEIRQKALRELVRVTKERIIVSYFSNVALSSARFHLKNYLRNKKPNDRVPIWPSVMLADAAATGLKIEKSFPIRYGLSPQTYLKLSSKHPL